MNEIQLTVKDAKKNEELTQTCLPKLQRRQRSTEEHRDTQRRKDKRQKDKDKSTTCFGLRIAEFGLRIESNKP
jgi:hypothetical protein